MLDKCLRKDPAERYQRMSDVLADLERVRAFASTPWSADIEASLVRGCSGIRPGYSSAVGWFRCVHRWFRRSDEVGRAGRIRVHLTQAFASFR